MQSSKYSRTDKTAFIGDQCKEIEENNRMGKIRDLLKKIRDTKGTFHTQKNYTKEIFMTQITIMV